MDDQAADQREREESMPEHEYREERGVGGGVSRAGTSEEGVDEGSGDQPGDALTADDEPPADV